MLAGFQPALRSAITLVGGAIVKGHVKEKGEDGEDGSGVYRDGKWGLYNIIVGVV